ncbi:hypothetical protein [Paenibacillus alkalitolerans]|uniref:hypothetical protein n=1 Tax=Paenibacillus alkalitolerans TaxID=2799335 RepID=UPI0018F432CF|nr:hypothetical protein [Paenibacillus alkalitolerans]
MKLHVLVLSSVLIVLSWVGNLVYYQQLQLSKPLFMKHYYDITVLNGQTFGIYYLANKTLDIDVSHIELPEAPDARITTLGHLKSEYTHQVLKEFNVAFHEGSQEAWREKGDVVITHINVYYTDGTSESVDIGEIHLRSPMNWSRKLEFQSGGGSSDGTGFYSQRALEDVMVTGIAHHFQQLLTDILQLELTVPGYNSAEVKDIPFPILLKKNDTVYLRYAWDNRFSTRGPANILTKIYAKPSDVAGSAFFLTLSPIVRVT